MSVRKWCWTHKSPTLNVAAFSGSSWFPCCPVWIRFMRKVTHTCCHSLTLSDWNCLELTEGFQRRHLFYLIFDFLQSALQARHGVSMCNWDAIERLSLCLNQSGNLTYLWTQVWCHPKCQRMWPNQGSNMWWAQNQFDHNTGSLDSPESTQAWSP